MRQTEQTFAPREIIQRLFKRMLSPPAFVRIQLHWRQFLFCLQTIRSCFISRTPLVKTFGAVTDASDFISKVKDVNVLARTRLCTVMLRQGSDKSYHSHNYTTVYSAIFKEMRKKKLQIFELGLGSNNLKMAFHMGLTGKPGASLRGWREFFPNARVYGADIDRDVLFQEDRIKTFYCDQVSQTAIRDLWSQPDLQLGVDIIVEDGLHTFEGNTSFLEGSLEHLRPGGIYVIEDIRQDSAEEWFNRIGDIYSKQYKEYEFTFVSLPTYADVQDNNLLLIRRNPEVQKQTPHISQEPSIRILGSRIHLVSTNRTVDHIERWVQTRDDQCRQVVVTGFHGLMEAHKDPATHTVLNSADLWVPDGIAPVWFARLRGHLKIARTPGTEIMAEFLKRASEKGYSSYFYGDTEPTLAALTATVSRKYPGHRIAGVYSPPFRPLTPAEEADIIDQINAVRPDILWVALGMPKQDVWIHQRLARLKVPVAIGVGAAFAFIAGTVSRCPDWMGKAGFEWVYRFLREPHKLWRRDLFDGPRFIFHAGMELLKKRDC